MVFLWFSYGFPMVFLWFSYEITIFPWFSHDFPMKSPFSYGFPTVFQGEPYQHDIFRMVFLGPFPIRPFSELTDTPSRRGSRRM